MGGITGWRNHQLGIGPIPSFRECLLQLNGFGTGGALSGKAVHELIMCLMISVWQPVMLIIWAIEGIVLATPLQYTSQGPLALLLIACAS